MPESELTPKQNRAEKPPCLVLISLTAIDHFGAAGAAGAAGSAAGAA